MYKYTGEELKQNVDNLESLFLAWKVYLHERENGANTNIHLPPPLHSAMESIAKEFIVVQEIGGDQTLQDAIANFGSVMFDFGQRAARDGVLTVNMLQCKCHEVTDEDLAKLSGQK